MGKTSGFIIGILQQLPKKLEPISALVLCATRELAHNVNQEFVRLGKFMEIKSKALYGGVSFEDQLTVLKKEQPHIIVGTPSRILALIEKGYLNPDNLRYFVLDECEMMLEQLGLLKEKIRNFLKTLFCKR